MNGPKMSLHEMDNAISMLKTYTNDEEFALEKIKTCLSDISICYESKQSSEFSASNDTFSRNFSKLLSNRISYASTLQTIRDKYELAAATTVQIFKDAKSDISEEK